MTLKGLNKHDKYDYDYGSWNGYSYDHGRC